ncbi:phosphotransferase, partial [Deinococcus sp. HMF7620]|nr:phosphotransferase [Deinococcus arboris]
MEGEALSSSTPVQAQRKVGALLARIHAQPGGRPPPQDQTWAEWMLGWLRHALAYWQASGTAPEAVGGHLSRFWQRVEPLLRARGHQLILFDGKPEHLIVTLAGEVALIDVEDLRAGDGLMDLAVLAVHEPKVFQGVWRAIPPSLQTTMPYCRSTRCFGRSPPLSGMNQGLRANVAITFFSWRRDTCPT